MPDETFSYIEPPEAPNVDDCNFYHRMELPELGEVGGDWDLRSCVDDYLGGLDYSGKRVLDMGAASGYLSFAMEERGAEVVSFDMDSGSRWNLVPQPGRTPEQEKLFFEAVLDGQRRLRNGYWKAHHLLASKSRAYYGDIYDLPEALGPFDVVFFGMIISHLRDPFQAIYSASRLCRDTLVITNQLVRVKAPVARFLPSAENARVRIWWVPSLQCLEQMLGLMSFEIVDTIELEAIRVHKDGSELAKSCTSVIARRT